MEINFITLSISNLHSRFWGTNNAFNTGTFASRIRHRTSHFSELSLNFMLRSFKRLAMSSRLNRLLKFPPVEILQNIMKLFILLTYQSPQTHRDRTFSCPIPSSSNQKSEFVHEGIQHFSWKTLWSLRNKNFLSKRNFSSQLSRNELLNEGFSKTQPFVWYQNPWLKSLHSSRRSRKTFREFVVHSSKDDKLMKFERVTV